MRQTKIAYVKFVSILRERQEIQQKFESQTCDLENWICDHEFSIRFQTSEFI